MTPRPVRRPAAPRPPGDGAGHEGEPFRHRAHVDADFAGTTLRGGELHQCTFTRCRLTGLQLPEGTLTDVRFVDCRMDLAGLRFASLTRVRFEGCALRELDLVEAQLQDVCFAGCDLRLADFGGARASRLELTGCEADGLTGVDGLRGALIRWPDALGLLGALVAGAGLVVLEEDEA